jgi:hypothetical protein
MRRRSPMSGTFPARSPRTGRAGLQSSSASLHSTETRSPSRPREPDCHLSDSAALIPQRQERGDPPSCVSSPAAADRAPFEWRRWPGPQARGKAVTPEAFFTVSPGFSTPCDSIPRLKTPETFQPPARSNEEPRSSRAGAGSVFPSRGVVSARTRTRAAG